MKHDFEIKGPYRSQTYIIGHLVAGVLTGMLLVLVPVAIALGLI